ncbi:Peroxisome biogenesis protein 6 [Cucurbita argyrosperma subsp. argyrosperma]|nr:Peroxisome biogenesis protein 6 [Cucurbita argyrosperma subsp. argyrosperma]
MVERRRPLVLNSTKALVSSVLNSSLLAEKPPVAGKDKLSLDSESPELQLQTGILRFDERGDENSVRKSFSFDDSTVVGVSMSVLKRLSITSGSLVLVKNLESNAQRVAQAIVLDPPSTRECASDVKQCSPRHAMLVFPSFNFPQKDQQPVDSGTAYLSPLLAFNLDFHLSCLGSLVNKGQETLASYLQAKVDDSTPGEGIVDSVITVGLKPLVKLPRYASHLRVSFVKVPTCGILESLNGRSSVEAEIRQEVIDSALQKYFEVERYLARGDIFSVQLNQNCKSTFCISCNKSTGDRSDVIIYFKVVAMEPSEEPVLRVSRTQTALVLGGSVCSALPPDLLVGLPRRLAPVQTNTVKLLASILTPPLCPSPLSSRYRISVLLYGMAGCGKRTVIRYIAQRLGLHVVEFSCHDFMASSEKRASAALAQAFKMAQRYSPTILLLRHFDVFRNLGSNEGSPNDQLGIPTEVASVIKEFTEPVSDEEDARNQGERNNDFEKSKAFRHPVLLVAAAESCEGLPTPIRRCFSHELKMGPLTEEQRIEILSQCLQGAPELLPSTNVEDFIKDVAAQTAGFMPRDLHALIADAGANLLTKVKSQTNKVEDETLESRLQSQVFTDKSGEEKPLVMEKEDFISSLDRSKKRNASALGAPKVPNVKWEDVGGLEDVKKSIMDTVQLPLLHKDLFSSGLRKRSGVLLYGPPGTGKTLLAKAVATECSLNFLSVKGPELINMYIGESEKNVRDIFQKARSARPCVIFFDELDSLAPARGVSGDSGGVMDRVVSQMLAEIDGLNDSSQDLFIIGASNRPDLIDAALLRPGRFDKLLYVGVNSEASYRERVLKALTRKFKLHENISLLSVAKKCPPNFTGADMYALCADAWFHAAKRKVISSDSSSSLDDQDDAVVVEYDDFVEVLKELSPSLSMAELKKYEQLRDQFEGASK